MNPVGIAAGSGAPLPRLRTHVDRGSEAFAANAEAMRELVEDLRGRLEVARAGGGESATARHRERGKLLVRERIDALLDPGAAFLECSPLAATGLCCRFFI